MRTFSRKRLLINSARSGRFAQNKEEKTLNIHLLCFVFINPGYFWNCNSRYSYSIHIKKWQTEMRFKWLPLKCEKHTNTMLTFFWFCFWECPYMWKLILLGKKVRIENNRLWCKLYLNGSDLYTKQGTQNFCIWQDFLCSISENDQCIKKWIVQTYL